MKFGVFMLLGCSLALSTTLFASDQNLKQAVESPDASEILKKDALPPPTTYTMPKDCITKDKKRIENGRIFFNNLNSDAAKIKTADGKLKQYGNCIACHNIEQGEGPGNIGPDLTNYNEIYVKSGVREGAWIYQKIADPRIDNPNTTMVVSLTNKTMTEQEVCDVVSYILADKTK